MERKEAKNVMISVAITALTLGTMGSFMVRGNMFQATALLIVAIMFMIFYALKYMRASANTKTHVDDKTPSQYYKRISKNRRR